MDQPDTPAPKCGGAFQVILEETLVWEKWYRVPMDSNAFAAAKREVNSHTVDEEHGWKLTRSWNKDQKSGRQIMTVGDMIIDNNSSQGVVVQQD